jgi:hypothetical protein
LKVAPELDQRIRPDLKLTDDSWRVDETDIKIKGEWKYLYRAVDSAGNPKGLGAKDPDFSLEPPIFSSRKHPHKEFDLGSVNLKLLIELSLMLFLYDQIS